MASFQMRIMAGVLPFLLAAPGLALAQTQPAPYPSAAVTRTTTTTAEVTYTRQQIDQLIAPIALYPDPLLTHVLMAATYPQQIIEAAQWVQDPAHAALHGDELVEALRPLPWAPSVKALVAVPQVIVMLSEHIEWTQALGVAVVTDQRLVLTRVQALRHLAVRSGRLRHVRNLRIDVRNEVVIITSAEPGRVVVPVYNPVVVYGGWPDREYPPVYIPPPPSVRVETMERGFWVSPGYAVVAPLWSWSRPDWRDRSITINRNEVTRITQNYEFGQGNVWRHQGPVVLAAPLTAHRENNRTASAVVGTVAPAGAAAVASLPQRAARLPNLIETPRTAARPGSENPAANEARGLRPEETPRGPQERRTAQPTPGAPGNAPAAAEQRGTAGFGSTRPGANTAHSVPGEPRSGQGTTASGMASPSAHNRNRAATGEPAGRNGGATAGTENRREHNPTTGASNPPLRNRNEATTTAPAAQHRATTTGAEHHNYRTTTGESAGRQSGSPTGTTDRSERRREQATTGGTAGSSVKPGELEHPGSRAATGESGARHGATNEPEHQRNRSMTTGTSAGHEGAAAGMGSGSEHQRSRASSGEPAGPAGGVAEGSPRHRDRVTPNQPQEAMPGSHGNAGTNAQHPASRPAEHRETAGEGASSPGAAAAHGPAARPAHQPSSEAGAGSSEPPGNAGSGRAHGR